MWFQRTSYDLATNPTALKQMRGAPTPVASATNLAIYKNFPFAEKYKVAFRVEAFNALNSSAFGGQGGANSNISNLATFGTVTTSTQQNDPRIFQFSLKLSF